MTCKPLFTATACFMAMMGLRVPAAAQIWTNQYHDPHNGANGAHALVIDHVGNVIVTGHVYRGAATGYDFVTVKMDGATGAILWVSFFNGVGSSDDYPFSVGIDSYNDVFVAGTSYAGTANGHDYATEKIDSATGRILWVRHWNGAGSQDDFLGAMKVDAQDNVVVTGNTYAGTARSEDITTIKYEGATGNLLWVRNYNNPESTDDYSSAVALDSQGNVLVTGYSAVGVGKTYDYLTLKYDGATGNLLWTSHWNDPGNGYDITNAIVVDHADDVIVTGAGYHGSTLGTSITTEKMDGQTGAVLWVRHNDSAKKSNYDVGQAIAVDSRNNVVVTGFGGVSSQGKLSGTVTIKYSPDGNMLWTKAVGGSGQGNCIAVDSQDNVLMGGNNILYKYQRDTGATLWSHVWTPNSVNVAAIAVDSLDNVFMTGLIVLTGESADYLTAKYAP